MEEEGEGDVSQASGGEALCYRQRAEKSTGGEMMLMSWSPTMDLLAASFADNSVRHSRRLLLITAVAMPEPTQLGVSTPDPRPFLGSVRPICPCVDRENITPLGVVNG